MTTLPSGTLYFNKLLPTGPADDRVRENQAAALAAQGGGSSFGDVLYETMAFNPTTTLIRKAQELGYAADPNFTLDQKFLDELTEGIDRDLWDKYADAVSMEHALYIQQTNRMMMEKRQIIAEGTGFSSFGAQMLGSLADPGGIAVGILTGGAGFAAKVGVIGNAAIAGGANMALTGLQASEDPSITGMDVLRAGAGGAGFGATQQLTRGFGLGARVAAGAAGQAFPAAAVDLFDDRPGNAKLLEFGTNLMFGGLFNAIPSSHATDAQIKMGETSQRVGQRMADQAQGKPVDFSTSIPAIEAVLGIDPNAPKVVSTVSAETKAFALDMVSRIVNADRRITGDPGKAVHVGTLGDFLKDERLRKLYADVLDVEITVSDFAMRDGKPVVLPDNIKAHGAFGFREANGKKIPSITVITRDPAKIVDTLLEEGAHALRAARGRDLGGFDWNNPTAAQHASLKSEQTAAKMLAHAKSILAETTTPTKTADAPEVVSAVSAETGRVKEPWDLTADEQARADKLKERAMRGEADLPEDQAFRDDLQNRLDALVNATPQQAAKMSDKNWQRWRGAKRNGTPDQAMDIAAAALLRGDDIALAAIKNDIADKLIAEPNADATPSEREAFQKKQDDWNATLDAIEEAEKQHKAKRESPPSTTPTKTADAPKVVSSVSAGSPEPRDVSSTPGAATAADTAQPGVRIPNNPLSLNLAEIVHGGDPNQVPFTGMSTPFNLGGIDGNLSQWSKTAMAGSSEVPEIRLIAQLIGFDPTLKADGSKALYATNEWLRDTNNRIMHPFFQGLDGAYQAHTKANPGAAMSEPDFRVAVGKALARDIDTISDPHVKQAAAHIRKTVYDGLIELAPDHGVEVGKVNNYVNRVHIASARDNFAFEVGAKLRPNGSKGEQRLLGRQVLETMFTNAGIKAGVDPEQAARNAIGIIEKAGVGSLVEDSTGASIGSGKNRTMERIELDETHRETITFPDGTTREFGVEDFLERDVLNLASLYTHQMTHLFAISRIGELMGVNMDGSVTRLEGVNAILKHVEEAAKLRGLRPEQYAKDLERATSLLKHAAGIPEHDTTTSSRVKDTLRNLAIFKTMGNVGSAVNNTVELLGDATATLGFWNTVTQIWPSIKDVYTLARKRQLSPETARELADLGAIMERYITRYMPRIGESIDNPIGRTAVELGATRLARLSMDASLQSFGQDVSVLATARAMVRKWEQIAASGQGFSEKRLGLMTLDKADEARIIEQIKAHSVGGDGKPLYENGVRRKGVEFGDLNEQAWDVDTRQTFFQARQHTNRTLIQQGNPTALAQWMTTPTGKVLAQLRGFSFGAHANKFLSELQVRDEITAKKVLYGTTAAGLAYIGRTYMDAAFQKDKEAFLERRLSTKNIALAAYSRASYAALFPTAFDGVYADILRNEGVFSQFRPSGTKGGALLGTPLVQTALDIGLPGDPARVFRAMYHAVTPARDFSRQDYDALKSGSMLPDILNLRKLADQYAKDLPAESQ